jgi:hypothetical protein
MPTEKTQAKVATKKLAFWESLIDLEAEPTRYLEKNEKVTILGSASVYGGIFADKEYYKVSHHIYGTGYMRKEGLEQI